MRHILKGSVFYKKAHLLLLTKARLKLGLTISKTFLFPGNLGKPGNSRFLPTCSKISKIEIMFIHDHIECFTQTQLFLDKIEFCLIIAVS